MAADPIVVHRIVTEPLAANCYVVSAASGDAIVLDPGGEADAIAAHLDANGLRPRAVVATHGHYDHVGAAADLVERYRLPFAVHSADAVALRRVNFCRFAFHGLDRVEVPDIDVDLAGVEDLQLGALEIAVVHTPGHSPGSVCLEVGGRLFTGDTLMATRVGSADMPGADPDALAASVRRLPRRYPADTVVHPGHGELGRLGEAVGGISAVGEEHA